MLIAVGVVVVVGSLSEIHAQSSGYRASTNTGYAGLASQVVVASTRTGRQLATVVNEAPNLPNVPLPNTTGPTARGEIEQGLDEAVTDSAQQATEAAHLVPPAPTGGVSDALTQVMVARATAVSQLRTAIDRQLGMTPLPIAGAPASTTPTTTGPLLSIGEASAAMGAVGRLLEQADTAYRAVRALGRSQGVRVRLPASVWVRPTAATSPLGATRLAALAPALALDTSGALVPFHQLVVTAVGLSPPAVASGAPGTIGTGCSVHAVSTPAGATPTVLPPTGTVTAQVTVTNCGTVDESNVVVTQTLALADPAGKTLPPVGARGAVAHSTVSLSAGSSTALTFAPMTVSGGHRYTLGVSIALPASQRARPGGAAGSSQQFLLQIAP